MNFRLLRADEIECRIATLKDNGCSVLLYKDARVDQNILDETVGCMNWQRHHSRDNANCIVSIWDENKCQWIEKEDTGKESNAEAEKGLASDSFKRACFNWGIGRELYTAPFIWISGKFDKYSKFYLQSIEYDENRNISNLVITDKLGKVLYRMSADADKEVKKPEAVEEADLKAKVIAYVNRHKISAENIEKICKAYKVNSLQELNVTQCKHYIAALEKKGGNINE